MPPSRSRKQRIVEVLEEAFADLMEADPRAFRVKYRKMAADPFAFYRGTACLFYADVTRMRDSYADDRTSRIWIHADLHAENFGTYLNSDGRLVFDVNDFDEAYIGNFTWDLRRFAASLALMGWQKALPEATVRDLIGRYVRAYLKQVNHYVGTPEDHDFGLFLDNTQGPVQEILTKARRLSRRDLLDETTVIDGAARVFRDGPGVRRLGRDERRRVLRAFDDYLGTIPPSKRFDRDLFYEVRDVVGRSGFGIGSAGLPAYNLLVEGYSQALDNDVVLSMKQANVPAVSRFLDTDDVESYFDHEGHRTVVSQRALQVHTDPLLGHTRMNGRGFVVAEVSPYEVDLDWSDIDEPADIAAVVEDLGRASAKVHCASDEDSDQSLVDFQVEESIAEVLDGRRKEFTADVVEFGIDYAARVRRDHALFVSAFREGEIGGLAAT
ncbi:MAG TPA: DUF2252 domain-containing protein [Nocardioidaceae bacterium]